MTVPLMRMVSLGRYFPDFSVLIFQRAEAQRVRPRYPEPCPANLGFATSSETGTSECASVGLFPRLSDRPGHDSTHPTGCCEDVRAQLHVQRLPAGFSPSQSLLPLPSSSSSTAEDSRKALRRPPVQTVGHRRYWIMTRQSDRCSDVDDGRCVERHRRRQEFCLAGWRRVGKVPWGKCHFLGHEGCV